MNLKNEVVQFNEKHKWCGCLGIVEEVKKKGDMMSGKKWESQSRYCDVPMARSKGLIGKREKSLGRCTGDCKNCIACIEVNLNGEKEHVVIKR